ncbi:MAG: hypothetical protein U5Q03_08945 [Bacteroidota bacterium]|nr:hypothetical protein [Bacteroidota bacterium]
MNTQRIEILLDKFFEGNTSLREEEELRAFFLQKEIPDKFLPLKDLFVYAGEESAGTKLDKSFDHRLFRKIEESKKPAISTYRRIYIYIASGVAATVLLVIGLFNLVDTSIDQSDLETAYNQTRNALIFVSEKLNQGMEPAAKVGKLNEGLQEAKKLSAFEKGMENLNKISEINNKPKEMLINKNN